MAKNYEDLEFTDDFMFGKVMEDRELCREVLECLLEEKVEELQETQKERELRYTADGKPVRLDVYTRDRRAMYDAEMQRLNHKKPKEQELPRRSRFYQSMMDVDFLQRGNSYRKLPDGRVLFICTFDPFGEGKARYVFENRCEGNPEIVLNDGTAKIFYNCTCPREKLPEDMPEELKGLYEFIQSGKSNTPLTRKLKAAVERVKLNEKWKEQYMKELTIYDDMKEEGRAEGHEAGLAEGHEAGLAEGRAAGRAEGKAEILLKLLGYRGSVPELLRGRIQAERDHERLDAWLECALESGSVEEFARKCGVCG